MKNAFPVLVVGFHVIGIDYRNEDSSQIVCSGVVHDFQNRVPAVVNDPSSSFSTTAFASGLSLVPPSGLTVCRQNLRVSHHFTMNKQVCKKNFIELIH